MPDDPNILIAPVMTLERGVSSATDPRLIGNNQTAWMVNSTVRGGFPFQRPGWRQLRFSFPTESIQDAVEQGRFQRVTHFTPRNGIPAIYGSHNGRMFRFNVWQPGDVTVDEVTTNPSASNIVRCWFAASPDYLLKQDGQARPWMTDGGSSRDLGVGELPTGCMMEYALGRFWVTLPDLLTFIGGDLIGTSSGTVGNQFRDAVLKLSQNGRAFTVPASAGQINAMRYMPNLDTSLGQGPVQVFVDNGAFSVNAPFDTDIWSQITYPIQTVSLGSPGSLSQESTVQINSDMWYRGIDGIYSFKVARRDFTMWGNVPISEEEKRLIESDTTWMLEYGSGVYFDNRMLMTASPRWHATIGPHYGALAVMDFDLISSLANRTDPCWEGMWTLSSNRSVLQILTGQYKKLKRCWAFVLNTDTELVELWELSSSNFFDYPLDAPKQRINWMGETRVFDFGKPKLPKQLAYGQVELTEVDGRVAGNFKYRFDDSICWNDWHSFEICSKTNVCGQTRCLTPDMMRQQRSYRAPIYLPAPPIPGCQTGNNTRKNQGVRTQFRWQFTGPTRMKQFLAFMRPLDEQPFKGCVSNEVTCTEELCCNPSDFLASEE